MLKRKIEQSETSIVKLQAHTEKFTYPRDLRYVTKANITPDEEFKTEIHSIKREAERKFIGSLTKFHYRRVERNNEQWSCEERNLINAGQRETLIGLSITPHAQSNISTNVLHSSTTWVEKIHRWLILAVECWQNGDRRVYCPSKQSPPDPIKFTAEISDKEINSVPGYLTLFKGERFNKQAILDIRTHFKPTETFQYTHFSSCHPPGVRKGFIRGEALRLLRTNSSAKSFVENITQFKTRLRARDYPNSLVERIKNNVRSQMKGSRHFNKERQCGKKNLPFVTTYHPALPNFKNFLKQMALN